MNVLALDPGNERSALVGLRGPLILFSRLEPNADLKDWVLHQHLAGHFNPITDTVLVIEQVASMGMSVGETIFETCYWSGRFAEAWLAIGGPVARVKRAEVKLAICQNSRATDSNIRTALLDHYGPGKAQAIGTKAAPGPLYGFKADLWAALALGLTYQILKGTDVTVRRTQIHEEVPRARADG